MKTSSGNQQAHERHARILALAAKGGTVSVEALARQFKVSTMTVRRDLAQLARTGRMARTHGGAVLSRAGVVEFSFQEKETAHAEAKRAIAREVVRRIRPGMTVALDTGTTTLEVARLLANVGELTVLTTSLVIASVLHAESEVQVVLLGGAVRKGSPDLSGPLAEENLGHFRVDLAVIGADAVSPEGTFTADLTIAPITRAIAKSAGTSILVADSSKFAVTAFYQCLPLSAFETIVTDKCCPANVRTWLKSCQTKVVFAG